MVWIVRADGKKTVLRRPSECVGELDGHYHSLGQGSDAGATRSESVSLPSQGAMYGAARRGRQRRGDAPSKSRAADDSKCPLAAESSTVAPMGRFSLRWSCSDTSAPRSELGAYRIPFKINACSPMKV